MNPKIKIEKDEIVYDGRFIQTICRYFIDRNGERGVWEMVRRKVHGRIVAIAALTSRKELVLEKCFRVPFGAYVIELPAGLMDKKGESEEETIRRELLEETGYEVEEIKLLVSGPFNPGLLADEIAIYYGTNAKKVQEPRLEGTEDIEVITVPIGKLVSFLSKEDGVKKDVKIASILPLLEARGLV